MSSLTVWKVHTKNNLLIEMCNIDTCSGSHTQSGAIEFFCLTIDSFAWLDFISYLELFSNSGTQSNVEFVLLDVVDLGFW